MKYPTDIFNNETDDTSNVLFRALGNAHKRSSSLWISINDSNEWELDNPSSDMLETGVAINGTTVTDNITSSTIFAWPFTCRRCIIDTVPVDVNIYLYQNNRCQCKISLKTDESLDLNSVSFDSIACETTAQDAASLIQAFIEPIQIIGIEV